jgi:hypothetical protein
VIQKTANIKVDALRPNKKSYDLPLPIKKAAKLAALLTV